MAHLSFDERIVIGQLKHSGVSQKEIAEQLGRSPSTISRELKRNRAVGQRYQPLKANRMAKVRRSTPAMASKLEEPALYKVVTEKLALRWSPQQVSGWLKVAGMGLKISHQTIYKFLDLLDRKHDLRQAMRRQGRRKRTEKPGFIRRALANRISIHERPKIANRRARIGDWELDLMRCHRSSGYLITAVERKTGYALIHKVVSKHSGKVMGGIVRMFEGIDRNRIKTFTFDNGSEFTYHSILSERLKVNVYFADPYNSGQRGTNENTNGLIRQYFPKTLDYGYISHQAVERAQQALNARPRLRLRFQTPDSQFT